MKDKYLGIITLAIVSGICIVYNATYAKEVVLMVVTVIAAVVRD